ncbi:hypothetical protein [Terrimicrobium sacchariphilum]|uniref:hypothetical protein n=1 Tax=Terrimicrobium sacchariphilum TaxID=690879 RepID=UPI0009466813|nr:hypothetical protein [Terrimicrobium sacchariphilum]
MRRNWSWVVNGAIGIVLAGLLFFEFVEPYCVQPGLDRAFLDGRPSRDEVISRFGESLEQIGPGGKFRMTGWRPLPDRVAEYGGMAFQRPNTDKIYVFFSADDRVAFYGVASS